MKDLKHLMLDMAHLYMNMNMRNRSNGGYQVGVEDLWRFCEEFRADMVILYEHIGCKSMSGYHGIFEEEGRKRGIHIVWRRMDSWTRGRLPARICATKSTCICAPCSRKSRWMHLWRTLTTRTLGKAGDLAGTDQGGRVQIEILWRM